MSKSYSFRDVGDTCEDEPSAWERFRFNTSLHRKLILWFVGIVLFLLAGSLLLWKNGSETQLVSRANEDIGRSAVLKSTEETKESIYKGFSESSPLLLTKNQYKSRYSQDFVFPNPATIFLEERLKELNKKGCMQSVSDTVALPTPASEEISALASSYKKIAELEEKLEKLQSK